jgi:hypothetical protein
MARRSAKPLSLDQCDAALRLIPQAKFLVKYKKFKNFKLIPDWQEAAKYNRCISSILDATGGDICYQSSLVVGMTKFAHDNGLTLGPNDIEESAYGLRAIISQIGWHKFQEKKVPREHQAKFQCIYDKMNIPGQTHIDDDLDTKDHIPVPLVDSPQTISDVEDLSSNQGDIFHSDDTELQQLLKGDSDTSLPEAGSAPSQPNIKTIPMIGGIDKDCLAAMAADDTNAKVVVSPASWAALQNQKKKEASTRGKSQSKQETPAKKMKTEQLAKKPAGAHAAAAVKEATAVADQATSKITWAVYSKREHSKQWHAEKKHQLSLGLTGTEARAKASAVASGFMLQLRSKRHQGELNDIVSDP